MPVLSRFFGIIVYMYWREHAPPHFHARYQDEEISVQIESGLISGHMSATAIALIQQWRMLHKTELLADWEMASQKKPLRNIDPLD